MEVREQQIRLDEREVEVNCAPKPGAMDQLQRAITKAWVLLLTNDLYIKQIFSGGQTNEEIAVTLSGMNPAPQEIVNLVGYAAEENELVAGSGVSITKAFSELRNGFQNNASGGWTGSGTHPGREELDATF